MRWFWTIVTALAIFCVWSIDSIFGLRLFLCLFLIAETLREFAKALGRQGSSGERGK